jgi:hypothetical protein
MFGVRQIKKLLKKNIKRTYNDIFSPTNVFQISINFHKNKNHFIA